MSCLLLLRLLATAHLIQQLDGGGQARQPAAHDGNLELGGALH